MSGVATKRLDYSHDLLADEALEMDRDETGRGRFFLYLALTIPHANNEAGKPGTEAEIPESPPSPRISGRTASASAWRCRDAGGLPGTRTGRGHRRARRP